MNWYTIKSKLLSFFSDIRIYPGGVIIAGDSHYEFKGQDMREALNNLQKGDVLLRRYSHYLGSVLVKGYYSHAAIYVGDNQVLHMLGEGITKEDILTFMRCDNMAILRPIAEDKIDSAVTKAYGFYAVGTEYDYDFNTDSPEKLYCTEFVDNCFGYPVKSEKTDGTYLLPDDFLSSSAFKLIWRKK
jgi:uncharacterized protein YycO